MLLRALKSINSRIFETAEEQIGKEMYLTKAEVSTTINFLKADKAPGEDDISTQNVKGHEQLWGLLTESCVPSSLENW